MPLSDQFSADRTSKEEEETTEVYLLSFTPALRAAQITEASVQALKNHPISTPWLDRDTSHQTSFPKTPSKLCSTKL